MPTTSDTISKVTATTIFKGKNTYPNILIPDFKKLTRWCFLASGNCCL